LNVEFITDLSRREKFYMTLLSARPGFNAAVRHIKRALRILDALEGGENFADALRLSPEQGLSRADSLSLLALLLADKLSYTALSANPPGFASDLPALAREFEGWRSVDMVAVFHDPRFLGIVNPKNAEQLAALGRPFPRELLVVYAGGAGVSRELGAAAARTALALLSGARPDIPPDLRCGTPRGGAPHKKPPPREAPGTAPLCSVAVSNDLFHYGNVEAWKRVVADYEKAHPGCRVRVYYDGEPILNINALFTWGKVRSGRSLEFSVAAPDGGAIPDLALLRRRLTQAAGRDFLPLLNGPAGLWRGPHG
jgi:hypothetical protein